MWAIERDPASGTPGNAYGYHTNLYISANKNNTYNETSSVITLGASNYNPFV